MIVPLDLLKEVYGTEGGEWESCGSTTDNPAPARTALKLVAAKFPFNVSILPVLTLALILMLVESLTDEWSCSPVECGNVLVAMSLGDTRCETGLAALGRLDWGLNAAMCWFWVVAELLLAAAAHALCRPVLLSRPINCVLPIRIAQDSSSQWLLLLMGRSADNDSGNRDWRCFSPPGLRTYGLRIY